MRDIVIHNTTSNRIIEFADLEYLTPPGGFKSSFRKSLDSRGTLADSNNTEMIEMDIAEHEIREIV